MNSALSNLRLHRSMLQKNLRYETPHEAHILGFGVPTTKNLAYGIPTTNALSKLNCSINMIMSFLHLCWGLLLELKYFDDGEENLLDFICIDDDGIVNNDDLWD